MDQHEHSMERDACVPAKAGVLTLKINRMAEGLHSFQVSEPQQNSWDPRVCLAPGLRQVGEGQEIQPELF